MARIDVLGEVRCSKNEDLPTLRDDAIHLLQHLADDLLDECVIASAAACRGNKVQLVDKADGWRYRSSFSKDVAQVAGSMAEIKPFQVRDCCLDKTEGPLTRYGARDLSLPRTSRSLKKNSCGDRHAPGPQPSASFNMAQVV